MSGTGYGTASTGVTEETPNFLRDRVQARLRSVPDFPQVGILFQDITPVLADPTLLAAVIDRMADPHRGTGITHVVAMESRGFLFGVPIALHLGAAFVPARKPGKLPWQTERIDYVLEYGTDALEIHRDALVHGSRVLVVDDVLATGGTAAAVCALVERLGGEVRGTSFLLEILALNGRVRLADRNVDALCAL